MRIGDFDTRGAGEDPEDLPPAEGARAGQLHHLVQKRTPRIGRSRPAVPPGSAVQSQVMLDRVCQLSAARCGVAGGKIADSSVPALETAAPSGRGSETFAPEPLKRGIGKPFERLGDRGLDGLLPLGKRHPARVLGRRVFALRAQLRAIRICGRFSSAIPTPGGQSAIVEA